MRRWTKILGVVLGVMVLASVIGVGTMFAADPQPATQPTSGSIFLDKLAARLKISVDQLKSAVTGAREDTLNELQAQGRITEQQKQAMQERLKARTDAGYGPGFCGGPASGAWGGRGPGMMWRWGQTPAPVK